MDPQIDKCITDKNKKLIKQGICDALNSTKHSFNGANAHDTVSNLINSGNFLIAMHVQLHQIAESLNEIKQQHELKKNHNSYSLSQNNSIRSLLKYIALLLVLIVVVILIIMGFRFTNNKMC